LAVLRAPFFAALRPPFFADFLAAFLAGAMIQLSYTGGSGAPFPPVER
jgi:hypothetical protein